MRGVLVLGWCLGDGVACQLECGCACGSVYSDSVLEEEAAAERESQVLDVGDRGREGSEVEGSHMTAEVRPVQWV
jgi:hypothetical protein